MNKLLAVVGLIFGVCFVPFFGIGLPMIYISLKELTK